MSIRDLNDWGAVELKAQTHELSQVDSPKVPEPPTTSEYFISRLATSLKRKDKAISEAIMWLSVGQTQRAMEVLNRGLVDL